MAQNHAIPMQQQYQVPQPAQHPPQMYYDSLGYQEPVATEVQAPAQYQPQRVYSISAPSMVDEDIWKHEDANMITPSARAAQGMHY